MSPAAGPGDNVREPDFDHDGWSLDDAEQRHSESPDTFEIPPLWIREVLEPGDFAKLIFKIAIDDNEDPEAFERMWVVVTVRTPDGYMGVLDNEPSSIAENDTFWYGSELPFSPRHIIDVNKANEASKAIAARPPKVPWTAS
ncbi:MAG: hypothetical protein Q7U20_00130 [Caulobacter sp.]|nr:hypothetical protein [Caulobacter sp.]